MKWTTKDNKEIDVMKEMGSSHATNVLNMLLGKNKPNTLLYLILKGKDALEKEYKRAEQLKIDRELELYGEMAQLWNDSHQDEELDDGSWGCDATEIDIY